MRWITPLLLFWTVLTFCCEYVNYRWEVWFVEEAQAEQSAHLLEVVCQEAPQHTRLPVRIDAASMVRVGLIDRMRLLLDGQTVESVEWIEADWFGVPGRFACRRGELVLLPGLDRLAWEGE